MAARLSTTRARKSTAAKRNPTGAPPADAGPGANARAMEEAEMVQLRSFVARIDSAKEAAEELKAPYDDALKTVKGLYKLADAAGFSKKELEARMEEMQRSTSDNARIEERERRHRRWLGIIKPEQAQMHLGGDTPAEVRDEEDAKTEGFKLGIRGRSAVLPQGLNARFTQPFMEGHAAGFTAYQESLAKSVPAPAGTDRAALARQIGEQSAADFTEDNPDVDLDAEARKLRNSSFMERSGEVLGDNFLTAEQVAAAGVEILAEKLEGVEPLRDGEEAPEGILGPDDGFAATDEELAAQRPRQAVQEIREATEGSDAVV